MNRLRAAFTLIEVVIALAILSVSLMVLVESQTMGVVMTIDAQNTLTANALAEAKLAEVLLTLEQKGFTESEQSEEGSFETFGDNGEYGEVVDFEGEYDDFHYAWTVRKVEMQIGDALGSLEQLQEAGVTPTPVNADGTEEQTVDSSMLSSFLTPEALDDALSPWMREVRVFVWWGDDPGDLEEGETCDRCVEIVTHVFNPTGKVFDENTGKSGT